METQVETRNIKITYLHLEGTDGTGKSSILSEMRIKDTGQIYRKYPSWNRYEGLPVEKSNGGRLIRHLNDFSSGEAHIAREIMDGEEDEVLVVYDRSFLSTMVYQGGDNGQNLIGSSCLQIWSDAIIANTPGYKVESKHIFAHILCDPEIAATRTGSDRPTTDEIDSLKLEERTKVLKDLAFRYSTALLALNRCFVEQYDNKGMPHIKDRHAYQTIQCRSDVRTAKEIAETLITKLEELGHTGDKS